MFYSDAAVGYIVTCGQVSHGDYGMMTAASSQWAIVPAHVLITLCSPSLLIVHQLMFSGLIAGSGSKVEDNPEKSPDLDLVRRLQS